MILEDKQGNKLVSLRDTGLQEIEKTGLLTHSLVVCFKGNECLFVHNNWKKEWELPGGIIEKVESAEECAFRELFEETTQKPDELRYYGVIEWRLGKEQRREFGALFFCELNGEAHAIGSEEISETKFWDFQEDIGTVSELDITLSILVREKMYL